MRHFPKPMTIVVAIVAGLAAIWLTNNVDAIGKLTAKR